MRNSILITTLAASLLLAIGCKKDESTTRSQNTDDNTAKPSNDEDLKRESDEGISGKIGGLFERGTSLGTQALHKGTETAKSAANTVTDTLKTGNESVSTALDSATTAFFDGRSWSKDSLDDLKEASEELVKASEKTTGLARNTINSVIEKVAATTDLVNSEKIQRIMVLMLPVIGPSRRYLDARALYAEGNAESDESKRSRARRETLLACAEMGLDIGTFGLLGGGIHKLSMGAEKVLLLLKVGRTVNTLTGSDNDILTGYLDSLLQQKHIRDAVDAGLSVGS